MLNTVARHSVRSQNRAWLNLMLNVLGMAGFVLAVSVSTVFAQGVPQLSDEQIRQFQQLSPQQQQMILQQVGVGSGGGNLQMSESLQQTESVTPRETNTPDAVTPYTAADAEDSPTGPYFRVDENGEVVQVEDDYILVKSQDEPALQPYGYDLFAGEPSTFTPVTDIPVSENYVLGAGDVVKIQLYGNQNANYSLTLDRDGKVNVRELGPIYLAQQTFAQAREVILTEVEQKMIGVSASVSLGELRSIRVFVLGEAYRPGSYTVSALSTITNALFVSGGISEIGSLRNIQHKRNGRLIGTLDLYDLLMRGDTRGDNLLQPGDAIFIPPVGQTIAIDGEVRRPAIYELKGESTVRQAVDLAGGPLPEAALDAVKIYRVSRSGNREIIDVNIATRAGRSRSIRSGDAIQVLPVLEELNRQVILTGHVQRPGEYQWRTGMRLTDILPSPASTLAQADFDYVLIKREIQPDRQITTLAVSLLDALNAPKSSANPKLQPRDEIIVFPREDSREAAVTAVVETLQAQARYGTPQPVVTIAGMVKHPAAYPMQANMRVMDLIRAGGGLLESAYPLKAEITRLVINAAGQRQTVHTTIDLAAILTGNQAAELALQPYDTLTIQIVPQWTGQQEIEIFGEVQFPGTYAIKKGETLSDVLIRAGGVTDYAFPEGAVLTRESLRKKEQQQQEELAERLEADIAAISLEQAQEVGGNQAVQAAQGLLKQVNELKPVGRLVIDLPKILAGESEAPIYLLEGDRLYIPLRPQEVTVIGEVQFPTSHIHTSGWTKDDYISRSGGTTYRADENRIFVVKANGEVQIETSSWFDDEANQIGVGDTVVVPLDADRVKPLTFWSEVTEIVYQVALSVAAFQTVGAF